MTDVRLIAVSALAGLGLAEMVEMLAIDVKRRIDRRVTTMTTTTKKKTSSVRAAEFKYALGVTVKDIITGYEGVIVSRSEFLNECLRYGVKPKELKDGKPQDSVSMDEPTLEKTAGAPASLRVDPIAFKFDIGAKVRAKTTGYEGTLVGRTQWIHGCNSYSMQGHGLHEGRPVREYGVMEEEIELVAAAKHDEEPIRKTGGPGRAPALPEH